MGSGRTIHEGRTTRSHSGAEVTQRERTLVTPFWVRFASETSLSPGWLLIAFPAVLYPLYLALETLFGRGVAAVTDFGGDIDAPNFLYWAVMLGCVSMMGVYVARGTFSDLEALRPVLRGGADTYAELRQQLIGFERRRLWIGGFLGFAFTCVLAEFAAKFWTQHILVGNWSLRALCAMVMAWAAWTTLGLESVYLIDSTRLYSRIGERHVKVDLLDLGPLSPLTRHGLRIVLFLTILTAAGLSVAAVIRGSEFGAVRAPVILVVCWIVLLASAAFVLPLRGLRRQIRARKAEELARVREDIRRSRELAAESGPESGPAGAKLPGLLAYKHEIDSVREWPFDAPTLTRFFLYVAIPIGSWVGGALVERLLGAALD